MSRLHPRAWIAWLAAAIFTLSLSRNPVYLLLIILCIAVVSRALRSQAETPVLPLPLLRLSLVIITLSALFNFVTAHFGQTVLFTLPDGIPLLGGPYTLEALVFGMVNGLVLVGFLAAFNVLYQALPTQALIHMIPRALYPIAVVVSIAVSFVPATLAQFQQIREAQMMRGHRVRGLRDWLPLFMPLLVGTTLLAGLLVLLFWQQEVAGWALVALGGGALLLALHRQGQRVQRTVYRRQSWTGSDGLAIVAAALAVGVYLLPASRGSLAWSPYPQLAWPGADPATVLATLGLLAPAALLAWPGRARAASL